ncbi:MAG: hypothetical protein A2X86_03790 [Bdellovibrionales bacterium GWA2_49_15]|nr:MAG: hypothetical protein A2X86_03790 [Bdellovibrionales bacterium GWA2_49_15]HAZ12339.1 hypothetical protein [Bdellovibrionales bacterium]
MKKFLLFIFFAFLLYLFFAPFSALFKHLLTTEIVPHPFVETFRSSLLHTALRNTFGLGLAVASLSAVFALGLAFLFTRTDFPLKSWWRGAFIMPYTVPPIVGAIAWILLANPNNGFLNVWTGWHLNIYSFIGLVLIETSFLFTYVLLILLKAFEAIDPTMEEASRMSGATTWQTFRHVTLPLLRAPLFNGFLLAFLATTASFGVPALIGTPGGIFLLTTQIYTFQKMGSMSGILKASSLSLILMGLAFIILLLSEGPLRIRQFATISGKTPRPQIAPLGSWKWPLFVIIAIIFGILFVLPLSAIVLAAFAKVQGILTWSNFGFSNFERILFHTDETFRAFVNSLLFAGTAGIFCVLAGFGLAYALKYVFSPRLKGVTSILVSLPYVTPGTVLALALLVGFGPGLFGSWLALNSTGFLIILAYSIKFLNFSYKTLEDGVGQIHPCLDEASRLSGAGTWQTMRYIWWPLLRPSIIASFFLVFMPAMFEVTMTVLLTGPGLETIGAFIFHLQEYGDLGGGGPAVLALLVIIPTGLFNFFLKFISKGKYGL